jgi:hypothetical protein
MGGILLPGRVSKEDVAELRLLAGRGSVGIGPAIRILVKSALADPDWFLDAVRSADPDWLVPPAGDGPALDDAELREAIWSQVQAAGSQGLTRKVLRSTLPARHSRVDEALADLEMLGRIQRTGQRIHL